MQHYRITSLLQKLQALTTDLPTKGLIDVDLMLDYTRVVYADLISLRQEMTARQTLNINEPTLDELTAAMVPDEEEQTEQAVEVTADQEPEDEATQDDEEQSPSIPFIVPVANEGYGDSFQQWMGLNDRYLFLQELFGNDAHKLDQAIKKIDQSQKVEELHEWLSEHVPESKDWDPSNEATETFYSLTGRYFTEKN